MISLTSYSSPLKINAPIDFIATTSISDEECIISILTNVNGICEACNLNDKSLKDIKISYDISLASNNVTILPFLGEETKLEVTQDEQEFSFIIPEINRGMVIIINKIKRYKIIKNAYKKFYFTKN